MAKKAATKTTNGNFLNVPYKSIRLYGLVDENGNKIPVAYPTATSLANISVKTARGWASFAQNLFFSAKKFKDGQQTGEYSKTKASIRISGKDDMLTVSYGKDQVENVSIPEFVASVKEDRQAEHEARVAEKAQA